MFKRLSILILAPLALFLFTGCIPMLGNNRQEQVISQKGIHRTLDRGNIWQEINNIGDNDAALTTADAYNLYFDPFNPDIVYISTNQGLYISRDTGNHWQQIYGTSIISLVLNPKTQGVLYITVNNQLLKSSDYGANWQNLYTETTPEVKLVGSSISHFDSSIVYVLTTDGRLLKSSDWGESWQVIYKFESEVTALLVDHKDSRIMFVPTKKNELYRSLNEGTSWTEILTDQKEDYRGIEKFKKLYFAADPGNLLYLSDYGIMRTQDNGETWETYNLITAPDKAKIIDISFNPNNINEIYYVVSNVMYQSFDAGMTWRTRQLPIPARGILTSLRIHPRDVDVIYISIRQ